MAKLSPLRSMLACWLLAGSPLAGAQAAAPAATLPLTELRLFTQVFDHVRRGYVDDISDSQLLFSAIEGMLYNLDPYSRYLDPETYRALREMTSGHYHGIGVEVASEEGAIRVISPLDETPAARAGIRPGDLIVAIDGASLRELSPSSASYQLRGPGGSAVELTVVRSEQPEPINITLTRELITVDSVRYRALGSGIGYVRIAQFQQQSAAAFVGAIEALQQSSLRGLVIDLRNNPGGLVDAAIEIAATLLDGNTVVSTQGRIATANQLFSAELGDLLNGAPVAVLINRGTASAAEIVAGALQDHRRAVVIGTRSFGKGSVQTIIPIDGGGALKLTTARYFTPAGRSIQAHGIDPDIVIERGELQLSEQRDQLREEDIAGHLEAAAESQSARQPPQDEVLRRDNQLSAAVNMLRAVMLLRQ